MTSPARPAEFKDWAIAFLSELPWFLKGTKLDHVEQLAQLLDRAYLHGRADAEAAFTASIKEVMRRYGACE